MKLYINANRTGYAPDQIRHTMTVGELIDALREFDEDAQVYLRHDGGYTYGGITYIIRFTHRGSDSGFPYEEQEHISLADAWNAFRLFAEPDSADLYSEIELAEHNWEEDTERSLARLTLGERYSF